MKSFLNCLILCGLVFLVACSGNSPKPPVIPPSNGDVWLITVEVSDSDPFVNVPIEVIATVALNGEPAPDGSSVEFLASGGDPAFLWGFSNGRRDATVLTQGGTATIGFAAVENPDNPEQDPAGSYFISARVKTVTSQKRVTYRNPDNTGALQIWSINPNAGSYDGGETVVLTGKGIRSPVEVFFTIQGGPQHQAIVDQVVPSVPLDNAGTITIRTPAFNDPDESKYADVKVTVGVGTGDEQTQTYASVFEYISSTVILGRPVIFGVQPLYGRSRGGETVTILGLNFGVDVTKELVKNFDNVFFTFQGQELFAQVERWSANQIEVITPQFSLTPLTEDQSWGIKLTSPHSPDDFVEENDVFIVLKDIAVPEILGISPTAGPLDGGTIVTITGHGFEIPVQVHFGELEATEVQVIDDQTPADNDVITCRTPDYSQQGVTPPYTVTITVINLQSGNSAISNQVFTFGDVLYVGQANPTHGQIGDPLVLYGAGFEDPLTVWFRAAGNIEFDVLAVTGTEISLRSPTDLEPTCTDRTGDFRVVLTESNLEASGGDYTLLGSNPTVISVDPIFVNEIDNGNGVVPGEIDIFGVRFNENLFVRINDFTIDNRHVTVESPEQIHVAQIPAPNDFGLTFDTTVCTTGTGLQGIKQIPTAVNVTVRNLPVGCENTLTQSLVYIPEDQSCQVAPDMQVSYTDPFPNVSAGTCSAPQPLVITNNGAGTLDIQTLFLQGRFFFQQGFDQDAGPLTVPPFSFNDSLDIYFCPNLPTGGTYNGQLVITSNNPSSPDNFALTGTEATPPEIATSPYEDGDTWNFPDQAQGGCTPEEVLTITNIGVSTLTIGTISSSDTQFELTAFPPGQLLPSQSGDLSVRFCPDLSGAGPRSGTLSINHDADNEPNPIVIDLAGNGT